MEPPSRLGGGVQVSLSATTIPAGRAPAAPDEIPAADAGEALREVAQQVAVQEGAGADIEESRAGVRAESVTERSSPSGASRRSRWTCGWRPRTPVPKGGWAASDVLATTNDAMRRTAGRGLTAHTGT